MRMEGLTAPWKWPIECSKLFRTSISTVSPGDVEEDEEEEEEEDDDDDEEGDEPLASLSPPPLLLPLPLPSLVLPLPLTSPPSSSAAWNCSGVRCLPGACVPPATSMCLISDP
jgi:hypothetical protein